MMIKVWRIHNKAPIWFKSIGVVFVMTLGLLMVCPLKAEAGLLDTVTGVVQKAATPSSSNPTKAASPESTPKPIPAQTPSSTPASTQATAFKPAPAQKRASVKLPAVEVDTPIVKVQTPAIEADIPLAPSNQSPSPAIVIATPSIQVPEPQVDTPIVRITIPVVEGDVPQTPIGEHPIKDDPPAAEIVPAQVVPTMNPIPITTQQESKESLPDVAPEANNLEVGPASGLAPRNATKDESIANPVPAINREATVSVKLHNPLEELSSLPETIPLLNAPFYHWFAVLATAIGAAGGGEATSLNSGGGTFPRIGMLYPFQPQLPLPVQIENYERFQFLSVNQWSKPPPDHPPQFMLLLNDH